MEKCTYQENHQKRKSNHHNNSILSKGQPKPKQNQTKQRTIQIPRSTRKRLAPKITNHCRPNTNETISMKKQASTERLFLFFFIFHFPLFPFIFLSSSYYFAIFFCRLPLLLWIIYSFRFACRECWLNLLLTPFSHLLSFLVIIIVIISLLLSRFLA